MPRVAAAPDLGEHVETVTAARQVEAIAAQVPETAQSLVHERDRFGRRRRVVLEGPDDLLVGVD